MQQVAAIAVMVGIVVGFSGKAFGQETGQPVELEAVVVTATRTEVPLKETASSVTIIDAEMIEERHLRTVESALREVPGLDIAQSGGPGRTTSAFLRGTNSNHTLVLIDGVPVNSATTGTGELTNLTTENIERIEVIRGPQSTLYGSEAVGGVIQILTKKGKGPTASSASLEGGSYGTFRGTAALQGSAERLDYSLSAARFGTQGFSAASEKAGNTEADQYQNTTWSSRVGVVLGHNARIDWTARHTAARVDLDGCGIVCPVDDLNFVQETSSSSGALKLATPVTSRWDQQFTLSFHEEALKGTDPDTTFNNYTVVTKGRRLDWQHNVAVGQHSRFTLGYEYESLEGVNQEKFDRELFTNAGYALGQHRLGPFLLNLGGRYDQNSQFEAAPTYKAEAAYLLPAIGTKIRAAYGTGFHGPTLNDLFFPGFGNPDLKPEKSRSVEAGLDQSLWGETLQMTATYFETQTDDLIVFVGAPLNKPVNVQKAKMNGLELEARVVPLEAVAFSAQYTNTETKNLDIDKELARRPRHKATGTVTLYPTSGFRVNLDVRYFGQRFNDTKNKVAVGDYTVVNLAGTYALTKTTQLFGRAENLFNQEYEEVKGYGTAGLAAYGGVKLTF